MKEVLRRFQAADADLSPESFEDGDDSFGRGNVPLLCPLHELAPGGAVEEEWRALKKRHEDVSRRLTAAKDALTSALPVRATRLSALKNQMLKLQLRAHASAIRAKAQESHVVILRDELRKMKQVRLALSDRIAEVQYLALLLLLQVLRRLDYVSQQDGVLGIKGRFACELSTGDELVLTNMVFDGCFNDLTGSLGSLSCPSPIDPDAVDMFHSF
jgi:superfamily II RNA helicase